MKFNFLPLFISSLFVHILTTISKNMNIIPTPLELSFDKNSLMINENTLTIGLSKSEKSPETSRLFQRRCQLRF